MCNVHPCRCARPSPALPRRRRLQPSGGNSHGWFSRGHELQRVLRILQLICHRDLHIERAFPSHAVFFVSEGSPERHLGGPARPRTPLRAPSLATKAGAESSMQIISRRGGDKAARPAYLALKRKNWASGMHADWRGRRWNERGEEPGRVGTAPLRGTRAASPISRGPHSPHFLRFVMSGDEGIRLGVARLWLRKRLLNLHFERKSVLGALLEAARSWRNRQTKAVSTLMGNGDHQRVNPFA